MVDRSENLAEYREMLILHADDEPWEERSAAVQAIDEILHKRGHLSLIAGQPLHPLPKSNVSPPPSKKVKRPNHDSMPSTSQNQVPSVPRQQPYLQNTSNAKVEAQKAESSKLGSQKSQAVASGHCVLCKQNFHLLKDCPLVRAGSSSIAAHIALLEKNGDPSSRNAIAVLRDILAKSQLSAPGN
jgi:hypothetical protein